MRTLSTLLLLFSLATNDTKAKNFPPSTSSNNLLTDLWDKKEPLGKGLSNSKLYKAYYQGRWYVIRDIAHKGIASKKRELEAQKIASSQGYGPKIYAYTPAEGKIVMEFLTPTAEPSDLTIKAGQLASLLKKMHDGPAFRTDISFAKRLYKILEKAQHYLDQAYKRNFKRVLKKLNQPKYTIQKPTHGDLNPNNIIFTDEGYKLIDFEDATQDDPFVDLATIIIFNFDGSEAERKFLETYFKRPIKKQEELHLATMKQAAYIYYGLTLLLTVPEQLRTTSVENRSLGEINNALKNGTLSTEKEMDRLLISKSMLQGAMDLSQQNK